MNPVSPHVTPIYPVHPISPHPPLSPHFTPFTPFYPFHPMHFTHWPLEFKWWNRVKGVKSGGENRWEGVKWGGKGLKWWNGLKGVKSGGENRWWNGVKGVKWGERGEKWYIIQDPSVPGRRWIRPTAWSRDLVTDQNTRNPTTVDGCYTGLLRSALSVNW